ncbi:PucR family transcriptional regulator [Paenibacillus sp. GCM10023250]|uniref:PucR family transcriptional regulator n=1 Tax=Paenibacillus sp. GCM10023250 TaxID=3252648 RepID=UPI00362452C4
MHLTIEQALAVYPLSEGKLIAGASGKHRVVKSLNVMDAPDIADWIKEGEMLFTTAYLIKDDPDAASELIAKLHGRGASGLGIKLGRFWEAIPERLTRLADELGFPLIALPFHFSFSDQMNGLFHAEMKRSTVRLEGALEKQIRLMRFALRAESLPSLFESVADVIGCPIAVVGSRGQIVHGSPGIAADGLTDGWPWPPHKKWIKHQGRQALRLPLMKRDACTGFAYFFDARPFLSPVEEGLYTQTAELISHHLNYKYEDYFELSVQKDFGALIKQYLRNGVTADAVTDYAARWEMDWLTQGYFCALVDLPADDAGTARRSERLNGLKASLLGNARMQALNGICAVVDEGVFCVVSDAAAGPEGETLREALESCLAGLGLDERQAPKAAISARKRQPKEMTDAFAECRNTFRLAREWGVEERIVRYDTLDLAMIFESVSREKMRVYCQRWLGGLLGKEPGYVGEMLKTLETYLDCDGQLNETAKKLFIHRNTATYRIEKLSELLDVDFKKVNVLMRLKLAFLFRRQLVSDGGEGERGA